VVVLYWSSPTSASRPTQQVSRTKDSKLAFDPLKQITSSFPDSIHLNAKQRTVEFCPDETCHRFVGSPPISITTLKDFAYLYVYFFSDYYSFPEWRNRSESRTVAERVLSKEEYSACKRDADFDSARCILLDLAKKGAVRLEFVRGDEGRQNVVRENVIKELTEKRSPAKQ
jgi:hypothetical protein